MTEFNPPGSEKRPRKPRRTQGRARSKRHHLSNLKQVLVQVAAELVEEQGARNVSLREVARRAGVSQTAPYNHFIDKEALLAAVATSGYDKISACIMRAVERRDARTPEACLRAFARGYVDFALEWPGHLHLIYGGVLEDLNANPELREARARAFDLCANCVARFMAEGNVGPKGRMGPRTAAVAAWALAHGMALLLVDRRLDPADTEAGTPDELIDQVTDVFIDALRAKR